MKQKIKLEDIKVETFSTSMDEGEKKRVFGGTFGASQTDCCTWGCPPTQDCSGYYCTDWGICDTETVQHSCNPNSCYSEGQECQTDPALPTCDGVSLTCTPGSGGC